MSPKIAILLISLGTLDIGMACLLVGTITSSNDEEEKETVSKNPEYNTTAVERRTSVSSRDNLVPRFQARPNHNSKGDLSRTKGFAMCRAMCSAQIEQYKQMIEDMQLWCNPYCQDELSECRQMVSSLQSSAYEEPYYDTSILVLK